MGQDWQDRHQKAQDRPKVAQFYLQMGQKGGKMDTQDVQEQPSLPQDGPSWPKMEQEGGKMGTQTGQKGAREAQVGPKSGQKKDTPKHDFLLDQFRGPLWGVFSLPVVF